MDIKQDRRVYFLHFCGSACILPDEYGLPETDFAFPIKKQ